MGTVACDTSAFWLSSYSSRVALASFSVVNSESVNTFALLSESRLPQ